MYVSLTYPLNIVQHTLSQIVEHCKLDSLTTPNNIVWSTVTSCWANNVCQFDLSLTADTNIVIQLGNGITSKRNKKISVNLTFDKN